MENKDLSQKNIGHETIHP